MNKTELIAAVAEKSGLTRKDSEKAVLAALETITETLKTGEKVQLVGFGVFETAEDIVLVRVNSHKRFHDGIQKIN